ncbi:hypothetical protein ACIRD2_33425 [Streptomyces sp. NPDC093595]|uniref:hypothetical protein n=1 Tax=Streptomyces sp. NPDC093595 TaxID=3366045 RepID=UPI0038135F0B
MDNRSRDHQGVLNAFTPPAPPTLTAGRIAVHVDVETYRALTESPATTAAVNAPVNILVFTGEHPAAARERREHRAMLALFMVGSSAGLVGLLAALLALYEAVSAVAASAAAGPVGLGVSLAVRGRKAVQR